MSSIINADDGSVSGRAGLKTISGNNGTLEIQSKGVTAITVNDTQSVTFANTIYTPSIVSASINVLTGSATSAFGQANLAYNAANTAVTTGQANVGSAVIAVTSAYQANTGAVNISLNNEITDRQANVGLVNIGLNSEISNRQANVGAVNISLNTEISNRQVNVGDAVISTTNAYQANVGAGLIATTNVYQANTGAVNISLNNEIANRQANVGAGRIADQLSAQANTGAGLIATTNAYQANVGAVNISLNSEITNRQANVGDAVISTTNAYQANVGLARIALQGRADSAFQQANLAYNTANSGSGVAASAFGQANLAYNTANSGIGIATSAFGQANLAYTAANSGIGIATSAFGQANLAYNTANSGSGVAASAFGQANLAYTAANTAVTTGQANVGAGLIATTSAYQANSGAGLITLNSNLTSAYQANSGAGLITLNSNLTSAYQANSGAGLITEVAARQANTGAGLISLSSTLTSAYQANVGAGLITTTSAYQANSGAGLISLSSTLTSAYQANTGAGILTKVSKSGDTLTGLFQISGQATINTTTPGTGNYGLHFTGQTTADQAAGITWNGGYGTTGAQAGIYVQGSGSYGTKMYFATTDSYASGSKTALSIDHSGTSSFLRSYTSSVGSFRAPLFYDSDDTTYYGDFASTSNIYNLIIKGVIGDGTAPLRLSPTSSSGTFQWASTSISTSLGAGQTMAHFIGNALSPGNSGYLGFNYTSAASGSNYVSLGHYGNDNILRVYYGTYTQSLGSMRAPLFYDSDDTAYYIDPNSTSNTGLKMRGGALFGPNTSWSAYLYVGTNGNVSGTATVAATNGNLHIDTAGSGYPLYLQYYCGGYTEAYGSMRSPIFYDLNDTGYYTNQASGSNHRYQQLSGAWAGSPFGSGSEQLTIRSNYPSMCHRNTDTGYYWLIHMAANNTLNWYGGGGGVDGSSWAQLKILDMSGNLTASGNITAYSDRRLKTNIVVIDNALDKIKKLRGVYFDWIKTGEHSIGMIAQEVEEVIPELVLTHEEIKPGEDEISSITKSLDYAKLVSLLIEGMKEQQLQIESQQKQIEELKSYISDDNK